MYPMEYNHLAIEIRQTEHYARWFASLRDRTARARIDIRIRRLSLGNAGDAKAVGQVYQSFALTTDLATEFILSSEGLNL